MEATLIEVIADFGAMSINKVIDPQKRSIGIGTLEDKPELSSLQEGQHVLLVEPDNLHAVGHIVFYRQDGETYCYGVIDGPIEDDE